MLPVVGGCAREREGFRTSARFPGGKILKIEEYKPKAFYSLLQMVLIPAVV